MPRYAIPRREEVWRVDLGISIGHEVQKTRPCVIVTSDAYNENNWGVLVVPLTSRDHAQVDQVLIQPPRVV